MMKSQHTIGLFVISLGLFNQHAMCSTTRAASERKIVAAPSYAKEVNGDIPGNEWHHYLPFADVAAEERKPCELPAEKDAFSITLTTFKAQQAEEAIALSWTTAAEVSNDFFTIERSIDGVAFTEIVSVDGQGDSESLNNYSYIDLDPAWGRNYYRLRQTNFDGTKEYFPVEVVYFTDTKSKVKLVWADGVLRVGMNALEAQLTTIALYTLTGQVINSYETPLKEGYNEIALEARPQVDQCKGVLVFRMMLDEQTVIKKLALP